MQTITSATELKKVIQLLEYRQTLQGKALKKQFIIVVESIKPVNILKSTFKDMASSPDLISNMLITTFGLTAGYFINKSIVGSSENLFKKLLSTLLKFGAANLLVKNLR